MAASPPPGTQGRLLCVYQHAPTPGAPGIYRHRLLLAELVRRGWHVDLVSSPINYMTGEVPERYRQRSYTHELIDGINHHWVRAVDRIHESKRRRVANYLSFAATALIRGSLLARPDVVWASSPPLTVASCGMSLARRFRVPWLYEVRDLWPESAASIGWLDEEGMVYRIARQRARRYATHAAAVVVPTPGLVEAVRGHGAERVEVVSGAVIDTPTDATVRAATRQRLGVAENECLAVYVGAHGAANGLERLLNAAAQTAEDPIRYVLVGDGGAKQGLVDRARRDGLSNLTFLNPVPKEDVSSLLAASDVCLHVLADDPLFHTALPTKVLEYLGNHRAFITTVGGLPAEIARESGGAFAPDTDALVAELRGWAAMDPVERTRIGDEAFTWGNERYGLAGSVDSLESLFAEVTAQVRV